MSEIFLGIWRNAPVWVWPLLAGLVFIGLNAMRTRRSSAIPYLLLPLLGLLAANSISGLVHVPLNWLGFASGYLAGAVLAFRWQDRLILEKTGWKMKLRGDRVTIVVILLIFFSNFANGVVSSVAPEFREALAFTLIFAAVIGASSGSFAGRALRVITLGNRP